MNLKVRNSDGRAGMAAVAGEVDIELLAKVRLGGFEINCFGIEHLANVRSVGFKRQLF